MHMFGLKIIKKKEYVTLTEQIGFFQNLIVDKDIRISELQAKVAEFQKKELDRMSKKDGLNKTTSKESNTILLTDVAEAPLEVEKPKSQRTTRKKTSTKSKPRKKSVSKTEE